MNLGISDANYYLNVYRFVWQVGRSVVWVFGAVEISRKA